MLSRRWTFYAGLLTATLVAFAASSYFIMAAGHQCQGLLMR